MRRMKNNGLSSGSEGGMRGGWAEEEEASCLRVVSIFE